MDQQKQNPGEPTAPADTQVTSDEPRPPWTVKFVAPPPQGMPSDRMKARAELVRASGCGNCCVY